MRSRSSLLALPALSMAIAPPGFIEAVAPVQPAPPPPRRRPIATQPESAAQVLRREIAEHNAAVAARKAEKYARRISK